MNAKTLFKQAALSAVLFSAVACNSALAANLVVNPGFETGDFTGWTQSGNTLFSGVATGANSPGIGPHSGNAYAFFGPVSDPGFLEQTLSTTPGETYDLSFWLANLGDTPNAFMVIWNGTPITSLTLVNAPAFGYTQFFGNGLVATSATTTLTFGFLHNPQYWGLDDVSVDARRVAGAPDAGGTMLLSGLAILGLALIRRIVR